MVHPKAAGIDVGNTEHWVVVPPHMDQQPVRQCGCFNVDLINGAGGLAAGVVHPDVAMQMTRVYNLVLKAFSHPRMSLGSQYRICRSPFFEC